MKHFIFSILIFTALFSCNPDKNKRADSAKLKFSTTDDAELFFRNLRQIEYDLEEVSAAKLQVFRHSDRVQDTSQAHIQLAIVVNWRFDEAYLLIEPNEKVNTAVPVEINWKDPETNKSGTYTFTYGSKEDHLQFAGQLYGSILDGHTLEYISASGPVPFLSKPEQREVFRKSMLDFYRLTGNIR